MTKHQTTLNHVDRFIFEYVQRLIMMMSSENEYKLDHFSFA